MERYAPVVYPVLRMAAGLLFCLHGLPKLFGGFGRPAPAGFLSQLWFAGIIEVFGGFLIMIGFGTAPVAFLASGQMAVAYFQAHFPRSIWPLLNGGELAALYCFVFLYFSVMGSGRWSVDALLRRRRRA